DQVGQGGGPGQGGAGGPGQGGQGMFDAFADTVGDLVADQVGQGGGPGQGGAGGPGQGGQGLLDSLGEGLEGVFGPTDDGAGDLLGGIISPSDLTEDLGSALPGLDDLGDALPDLGNVASDLADEISPNLPTNLDFGVDGI
ncbi:MAG: hypothetical protein KGR47_14485, partial [Acidobacteria bacterium]|nr:hypothetical protein [Acidobacteriota bacterium]